MGEPALPAPGPGLAATLSELDPARLDPAGLVDALVAFERLASWVAAGQARVLSALGKTLVHGDEDWTREEVAAALRLSGQTARLPAARRRPGPAPRRGPRAHIQAGRHIASAGSR